MDEQTGARIDGGDPTGRSGLAELLGGKPTQEDNINGSGAIREQSKTKFRTKPDKYSEGYVYRTQVRLLLTLEQNKSHVVDARTNKSHVVEAG